MNKLIKLIIDYRTLNNNETFERIIIKLDPIINDYLLDIPSIYKEDVKQEILMSTDKMIKKFKIKSEIINEKKYFDNFMAKKNLLNNYKSNINDDFQLNQEFILFCNQNQFYNYFIKIIKSKIADFYKYYDTNIISLNSKIIEQNELLDLICDNKIEKTEIFNIDNLNDLDYQLLELKFGTIKYSDKEIGILLGISQQAVNKRKHKLLNKIKNYNINFSTGCKK